MIAIDASRITGGVDNDARGLLAAGFLDVIDEFAFTVRLTEFDR